MPEVGTVPHFSRQQFISHLLAVPTHEAHRLAVELRGTVGDSTTAIKDHADLSAVRQTRVAQRNERVAYLSLAGFAVGMAVMGAAVMSPLGREAGLAVCAVGGLLGLAGGLGCAVWGLRSSAQHEEAHQHHTLGQQVHKWAHYFAHAAAHRAEPRSVIETP